MVTETAAMPLKVALVGSAPASSRLAPYGDHEWQIWGCSPGLYGVAPRVTEWFEMHLWEPGQTWFSPEYCQWLAALPGRGVKLWTGAPVGALPGSEVFPANDILAKYDPQRWFCSSSLFWMMARAIDIGATKIGLWGVDMAAGEEYEMQRAGIHFLTYIARSRGIEVGTPAESDLFTPRFRYAVDEWTHSYRKVRARNQELQGRLAQAQAQAAELTNATHFIKGALDDLKYMGDTWADKSNYAGPTGIPSDLLKEQTDMATLKDLQQDLANAADSPSTAAAIAATIERGDYDPEPAAASEVEAKKGKKVPDGS